MLQFLTYLIYKQIIEMRRSQNLRRPLLVPCPTQCGIRPQGARGQKGWVFWHIFVSFYENVKYTHLLNNTMSGFHTLSGGNLSTLIPP